jgi:hypothetical protein
MSAFEKAKGKKPIEDSSSSSGEGPWRLGKRTYYRKMRRDRREWERRILERLWPLVTWPSLPCEPSTSTARPSKRKPSRPPLEESKGAPKEEDSQPELDYEMMDIQYEYPNPQLDAFVVPLRYTPHRGYLEGYWISSDSVPPNSDNDSDEEKARISKIFQCFLEERGFPTRKKS